MGSVIGKRRESPNQLEDQVPQVKQIRFGKGICFHGMSFSEKQRTS